ncbi:MAG: DNA alkylation repair protein [Bacteroidales bacterium]|nr:DNA alkylation repair protein [Bacteroidales bacterium]
MQDYLESLNQILRQNANPTDAVFMKKYMLNQFEYFGIRAQKLKELGREFIKNYGLPEPSEG